MILAVDTASRWTGIALFDPQQGALIEERGWVSVKRQTVELGEAVANLLTDTGVRTEQLTGLVSAIGPGSYTGLRIGLGFLKGISLVHNQLPIVGVYTHDIVAAMLPDLNSSRELIVTVEAGRKRILTARYTKQADSSWERMGSFDNPTWPELIEQINNPVYIAGEVSPEGQVLVQETGSDPDLIQLVTHLTGRSAGTLARLGWQKLQMDDIPSPLEITPYYLRSPEGS